MGLKFRRGTNAQKSGSLAFGEPYVNTDLGTLQIGGLAGDITLGASGTGSAGSFSAISGSGLDITGNANIAGNLTLGGNITVGDQTTDTLQVVASLSSSLIPQTTNAFDLGSATKIWKDLYISTGSIKFVEGTTVVKTLTAATLTSLEAATGSSNASITTLNSFTSSTSTTLTASISRLTRIEESTASLNLTTASFNGHITDINTKTGSLETKNTTLATYTASIDTKFSTLQTLTASMAAQVSRLQESTASLNAFTNSFNSAIQLTGSNVNIGGNLIVAGTTTTINSTNVTIADSVIELNYGGSVVKGGILIKDGTGGSTISGSLLWDGTNDYWIAGISGSELPLATTTGTQTLTNKTIDGSQLVALSVANGKLANSSITIAGTSTTLGGAITAEQIRTAIGTVVTGSAQIDGSQLGSNKTITVGSTAITLGGTATTIAGLTSVTSTGFTGALTGNASTATTLATARNINGTSFNGSADITIANLVSGSSQIDHNSTTNYVANRHIDHTAVSISAGSGLSGGGDISTTRTLSLDTTSATFTSGVTTQNNALSVVSGSKTISGIVLGSNLGTLTISTGLSGTSYNGSTGVTIANTGVLSITTNTGLSANASATGNVTITNTGVTSNVAGTGIGVSGATGAVTITNNGVTSITGTANQVVASASTGGVTLSLPQNIHTAATPTFAGLTINGAITATGDITAYYTSDKRHKNNIQTIPNALEKVTKLNGVIWEWNDDVNEVTKSTPKTGLIAQEVQEVLPEVVKTRDDGFLALDYSKMMGLMVEAIKEQQTQIHSLTLEIEKLKESKGL